MQGQQPTCFGKLWDPNNKECRGGNDPLYVNPRTGTNKRDMCSYYGSCSAATNHGRLHSAVASFPSPPPPPPHVFSSNLVRAPNQPPQPMLLPTAPPAQMQQAPMQPMQMVPVQQQQQVAYMGHTPYTQPQFAAAPAMVPMNQPMLGAAVPSFLTVPEPDNPDVPVMTRFARTLWRSTCKAAAIGAANFIDFNPITPAKR